MTKPQKKTALQRLFQKLPKRDQKLLSEFEETCHEYAFSLDAASDRRMSQARKAADAAFMKLAKRLLNLQRKVVNQEAELEEFAQASEQFL